MCSYPKKLIEVRRAAFGYSVFGCFESYCSVQPWQLYYKHSKCFGVTSRTCSHLLGLGLFDFHLSHSHKARCVDNRRKGDNFRANCSLQRSMGFPQKGAVPLVRPISSSSAALVGSRGRGSGGETNETPAWLIEPPLKYLGEICMQKHLFPADIVCTRKEPAKKH